MNLLKPPLRISREMIEAWDGHVPTPPPGYEWVRLDDVDMLEARPVSAETTT